MIVDAHHHLWDPEQRDYGWLTPASPLHRAYTPADFAPLLARAGVTGTVLVQAAADEDETDALLAIMARTPWVLGVVGWLDLAAPDLGQRLAARPGLVGVRPMLQDLADPDWILRPELTPALSALTTAGLAFDALVRAPQLGVVPALADRHPTLRIVLDHAGKPPFGDKAATARWADDMEQTARRPNVSCKLSGLLTELSPGQPRGAIRDCAARLLDWFGPQRLLWGSDWPVLTLATDYDDWWTLTLTMLDSLAPEDRAAILGGNARTVYRLTERPA